MKRLIRFALLAAVAVALTGPNSLWAQTTGNSSNNRNRGNRDPAQFLERRMQRYREQLEIKSDDEWKAVQPLIEKVLQAQREARAGGFGGGRGGPAGGGGQADRATGSGAGARGGRFTGGAELNPDAAALQKALDSKASAAEIKAALTKMRDSLKQKEADLEKAQDALRQVLTARQEAIAVLSGLLR